jgi:hypothetical protein
MGVIYILLSYVSSKKTEVFMDELEAKAREYKVFDLTDFYASPSFRANGFEVDATRKVIIRRF